MEQQAGPVYRATAANRVLAGVAIAAAVAGIAWVTLKWQGFTVVPVCFVLLIVAFLALSAMRFEVRAEPDHLVVCSGGRRRHIPWSQIKSFGVGGPKGRDVFVVLADKSRQRLPLVDVTNQQTSPDEVRDALQRYWRHHRR